MRKNWFVGAVVSIVAVLGVISANAAIVHIGPSATGNGSGSDWNNQAAWSGVSFVRGNTYYVAGGAYGAKTFATPHSGSTYITIKKAIASDHGTDVGWNAAYGSSQAVINSTLNFQTGYWILDGQTRSESDWFQGSSYGFTVTHNNQDQNIVIRNPDTVTAVPNITIKYVYVDAIVGNLPTTTTIRRYAVDCYTYNGSLRNPGLVFSHIFVNGSNNPLFLNTTEGAIVEYSAVANAQCNAANHAEVINLYYTGDNAIIRYNNLRNSFTGGGIGGTVLVATGQSNGIQIYGNIFDTFLVADGAIGFNGTYSSNNKVYNNTFVNCDPRSYDQGCRWGTGTGNQVYNNLWINGTSAITIEGAHDYNGFSGSSTHGEANGQANLTTSIFVNAAAQDYRLSGPTAAGMTFGSPFNLDIAGNTRGSDGLWDRGAYDYGASGAANLVVNAGADTQVTLPNSLPLAGSVVNTLGGAATLTWSKVSGPGTVTFSAPSAANGTATFSTNGTYVLRLTAKVLTVTTTDDMTVTVLPVPDTVSPSVSLTAPASGAVSGQVTLSASASDNVGVEGVKFFVGTAQVADVTTSPYSYLWDSRWVANGSYKVYAQARDAAGNIKWSATNNISISNAANALPTPSAYWAFDESSGTSATDLNAGSILTLRNGPVWVPGRSGNALQLDGINDRADAPNNPAFDYDGNQITVAAWVKLENLNNWQQIVVKVKEEGAFNAPFFAWHMFAGTVSSNQWRPQFQLVNVDQNSVNVSSTNAVNYSEWVHVAGVYDGSALHIYVNGVEQGNAPQTGNIIRFNQPLYVGAHGQPGEFAKGAIDDLRIYSGALSAAQIQQLSSGGAPRPLTAPNGLHVEGGL